MFRKNKLNKKIKTLVSVVFITNSHLSLYIKFLANEIRTRIYVNFQKNEK